MSKRSRKLEVDDDTWLAFKKISQRADVPMKTIARSLAYDLPDATINLAIAIFKNPERKRKSFR